MMLARHRPRSRSPPDHDGKFDGDAAAASEPCSDSVERIVRRQLDLLNRITLKSGTLPGHL